MRMPFVRYVVLYLIAVLVNSKYTYNEVFICGIYFSDRTLFYNHRAFFTIIVKSPTECTIYLKNTMVS
jgi:hypothetical protein